MTNKIFNTEKSPLEYMEKNPLFFGTEPGLFNTLNKPYPKIWSLYKTMKSLDWSEDEFDYTQCNLDFKNCPKSVSEMMIRTLAWQWEADSVASRSIAPVLAPFITDTSLWAAWQRISDNEIVHAATYSEIVRMSFDNPEQVMANILEVKESIIRMDRVNSIFANLHKTSHQYAIGQITAEQAYDDVFMGVLALLMLERIQFMASFAVTFTICSSNWFQSIGKAVQKIAQDELEVHVELDKEVIKTELATKRGLDSYQRQKEKINQLFNEVVQTEIEWIDYLFSEGRELVGATPATLKNWVLFNARDVAKFLNIETNFKFPKNNPMPHLDDWINIGNTQAAPQEQDNNAYKVNSIARDDSQTNFEIDF
jgi:ribonucleoside-diphosphate reductase beta chain